MTNDRINSTVKHKDERREVHEVKISSTGAFKHKVQLVVTHCVNWI